MAGRSDLPALWQCRQSQNNAALQGKAHRPGLYQCAECREHFTVTVKTVFERSKIPLNKWLAALFLMTASKKGVSAHQIHRMLGIHYKSTWFMMHRLREAMRSGGLEPLGGNGKIVEADEKYFGNKKERPESHPREIRPSGTKTGWAQQQARPSLLLSSAAATSAPSMSAIADGDSVTKIVRENIHRESRLHTDESRLYKRVSDEFAAHETVNHSRQRVRSRRRDHEHG